MAGSENQEENPLLHQQTNRFVNGIMTGAILAYSNGSWASSWDDLGCCTGTSPTIASEGVNGLDVFVNGTGSNAGFLFQQSWNGTSWNGWTYLNGGPGGGIQGGPAAVSWGVGQIDIVAHGGGSEIYHLSQ